MIPDIRRLAIKRCTYIKLIDGTNLQRNKEPNEDEITALFSKCDSKTYNKEAASKALAYMGRQYWKGTSRNICRYDELDGIRRENRGHRIAFVNLLITVV